MAEGHIELYKPEYAGLAFEFEVNPDSCSNNTYYELYIRFDAATDYNGGRGTTFVFLSKDNKRILGYITLRANSFLHKYERGLEGEPAMEILELAVSKEYERQGIGTALFQFAVTRAADVASNYMGVRHLLVCADPPAVGFYSKMGLSKVEEYGQIPRDGWNDNCVPMFVKLPGVSI